jgi:hypothetical protein
LARVSGRYWVDGGPYAPLLVVIVSFVLALVGQPLSPAGASNSSEAWSATPSANPADYSANILRGASCVSSSDCTAVGFSWNGSGSEQVTLVESWNGSDWSVVPSPNVGDTGTDELAGISCISTSSCVAVGYSVGTADFATTLVELWNGKIWSIESTPNPDPGPYTNSYLRGVSCKTSRSCMAVGYAVQSASGGTNIETLAEFWNGMKWSIIKSPNPGSTDSSFDGISCVTAATCQAVGSFLKDTGNQGNQTLVESWNGRKWSVVPSPNDDSGTTGSTLDGISCVSKTSCLAVGSLATSWNGRRWSEDLGGFTGAAYGVVCVSSAKCVAVGYVLGDNTPDETLVESWNGKSWTTLQSPNPGDDANILWGVACARPTDCNAVGFEGSGEVVSPDETLVETGPA